MDKEVASGPRHADLTTRYWREEDAAARKELMDDIEARFCEYGEIYMWNQNHAGTSDFYQRLY